MGFISTIMGIFGFGMGFGFGLVVGYFLFIYFQPTDVENPEIRPLVEQTTEDLQKLIPEIPIWIKNPDYDRLDWLNKFIEYMWPYLDKAICKMAKKIAEPIIAEEIPKYKIESVEFETLTLGSLPPTFQGMKVYNTEEKELIMELGLKWAANPNILVAVKAFGLKATVQVLDLQVFALPRITLKPLVPVFPFFANIHVSLMEKPHVDFGVKLLGCDAMSIPGVYRIVQELIKDQVANMYLWPKRLEVQIMDPATAMQKPRGLLNVKVIRAMKLKKKDLLGASDPYVKLTLSDDKVQTKKTTVKMKNLNPEWDEEFSLAIRDPETQILKLTVYDWDEVGSHDKMGLCVVPNEKSRGQIVVEVNYKPFKDDEIPNFEEAGEVEKAPEGTPETGGLLVIIIHEAQDVEGKYHTNPSVRLHFRGEEKKTKTVKKNRDPRWEEEFQFVLEEPPTNDRVHVEVRSSSKKLGLRHPKETLGYVDINLADVVHNKRINERYHLIDSKNDPPTYSDHWRVRIPRRVDRVSSVIMKFEACHSPIPHNTNPNGVRKLTVTTANEHPKTLQKEQTNSETHTLCLHAYSDLDTLLKLKLSLIGSSGSGLRDWAAPPPSSPSAHCSFSGVTCDADSRVTSLNVTNLPLLGTSRRRLGFWTSSSILHLLAII
ncbi:UNVERIFIED_CONTAM: Synaptotagmin-2 [Sesamum calycinum]|uniref:Synaptotagmin-2 n=1 Tax=Sesamum calycinum TaxID=2727403 RepID=A0AAW2NYL7_9LAMI